MNFHHKANKTRYKFADKACTRFLYKELQVLNHSTQLGANRKQLYSFFKQPLASKLNCGEEVGDYRGQFICLMREDAQGNITFPNQAIDYITLPKTCKTCGSHSSSAVDLGVFLRQFLHVQNAYSDETNTISGVPNLQDLMPDDLRWSCNRNKVHNKCRVLESSGNHHPTRVHGKIVFHKTSPW